MRIPMPNCIWGVLSSAQTLSAAEAAAVGLPPLPSVPLLNCTCRCSILTGLQVFVNGPSGPSPRGVPKKGINKANKDIFSDVFLKISGVKN